MTPAPSTRRGDRGSVLFLMPVAVLIILVLGAISVDLTVVQLDRRELVNASSAAANDAVTEGLDEDALRRGNGYTIDTGRARRAVLESLDARGLLDRLAEPPTVLIEGPDQVTVALTMRADYVFAGALPGTSGHTIVRARSTANATRR